MIICAAVDPGSYEQYAETSAAMDATVGQREFDFIKRHHLLANFYSEDAKGLR